METLISRKTILIIIGFLAVLALATNFGLRWYGLKKEATEATEKEAAKNQEMSALRKIKENQVVYANDGFSPKELILASDKGLGCVVNVENQSTHPVTVGLSPHNPVKDPGQNYLPVSPGENIMFDPRYSGYTELSFHDHERPEFEFTVKFEKSCQ